MITKCTLTAKEQFGVIFVINLFSGWTGFGWIVALALAFWNFERVEP